MIKAIENAALALRCILNAPCKHYEVAAMFRDSKTIILHPVKLCKGWYVDNAGILCRR